jgi:phage terminase small subunit
MKRKPALRPAKRSDKPAASGPLQNAKHEAFARGIVEGKSGREAYRAGGYAAKAAAADANASRLLKDARVAARVAELKAAAAEATKLSAARILEELGKLAFSNMLDFMRIGGDGQPRLDFSALRRDQAAAIHELVVETRTEAPAEGPPATIVRTKFKLADKRGPLTDLAKHFGLLVDRHEHEHFGKGGGPIETREVSDYEAARRIAFLLSRAAAGKPAED